MCSHLYHRWFYNKGHTELPDSHNKYYDSYNGDLDTSDQDWTREYSVSGTLNYNNFVTWRLEINPPTPPT